MKTLFSFIFTVLIAFSSFAKEQLSEKEKQNILNLFDKQVDAWNDGNLEKFMETYWKSDKLIFIGSRGPSYGWQAALDNYKKGYPDKETMGHLEFKILEISKIDRKSVFVVGRFEVTRRSGDLNGHFSLVVQKINGKWLIVSDHSSAEN